ncbi:MAG: hypothetical protein IKY06_01885 [Clostridia bacterium]|nr:hypothetical protein [Clostridia bacterium]
MKKIFAIMLVLAFAFSFAFAEGIGTVGGWTPSADPEVTEEQNALFEKALAELMGVDYKPVAYLGSQIVAGRNHCFLAQATVVYPGAEPYYVLIYIYEDLEGDTEILNIYDLDISAFSQPDAEIFED